MDINNRICYIFLKILLEKKMKTFLKRLLVFFYILLGILNFTGCNDKDNTF